MRRITFHALIALLLTALSFSGGLAWLASRMFRRNKFCVFALLYVLSTLSFWAAAMTFQTPRQPGLLGAPDSLSSPLIYSVLNRNFVTPELARVTHDLARHMEDTFPGTRTIALDGGFPALNSLPLLPHLSHADGRKLDLGLYWQDSEGRYLPNRMKSVLGYWGYADGPSDCPKRWNDLRWDLTWLQPMLPQRTLDTTRTREALLWLARDDQVKKILIEPHILERLNIQHPKIRFQGCRAARHDDHIHFQL